VEPNFFRGEKAQKLRQYLDLVHLENGRLIKYSLNVKFSPFEFTCQLLRKLADEEIVLMKEIL
jgi:hypothetical protein